MSNYEYKVCGACAGSGYYDSDGSPKCGICNGLGEIKFSKYEEELLHILNTLLSELKKALPIQPRMDGINSFSHTQKIVYRAIKECEDKLNEI